VATRISIGTGALTPTPTNPWAVSGTVEVGDVVYQVSGADRTVARAKADDAAKRPPMGMVFGKSNGTVLVAGNGDLASGLSGLTTGTVYWLSTTAGQLVDTKPASNAYLVGVATSPTELLVGFTAADLTAGAGGGSGTVTSVGVASADGSLSVSGSPITSSGDVTVDLATVAVADGGTGLTSTSEGALLLASSSGAYVAQTAFPFMRNRLINGAQMVSQRYVDRPVAPAATAYPTDRWVASSTLSSGSFLAGRSAGWSNSFDGSGDIAYVNGATPLHLSGDFTLEMWVNPSLSGAASLANYALVEGLTYYSWNWGLNVSGGTTFTIRSANAAAIALTISTPTGVITANTWSHLAVVRSGTSFKIFVNGSEQASGTSSAVPWNAGATYGIGIGGAFNGSWAGASVIQSLSGSISNFRIVKGTALYTSTFTPSTMPLVPVANTSLLTCGSETFQDKSSNNFAITAVGNAAVTSQSPFTVAPTGFTAGLQWSVTAAASALASQYAQIQQRVEGTSVYDLAWGTASAKAVTLSFWVRSPVTGTYCVAVQNAAQNRSYIVEYTVSAANTWEKKVIAVPGDTSGTWPTTAAECLRVVWDLGSGTNFNGTAGSWLSANDTRTTNQTNFIGTALASGVQANNFLITGVQLEMGSVATPFEFRPMQAEMALCQRYYARLGSLSGNYVGFGSGAASSTTIGNVFMSFPQPMRSGPVIGQSETCLYDTAARAVTAVLSYFTTLTSANVNLASSSLTLSRAVVWCGNNNPNAYVELDAEL
jgi:hypothetical protein